MTDLLEFESEILESIDMILLIFCSAPWDWPLEDDDLYGNFTDKCLKIETSKGRKDNRLQHQTYGD